MPSLQAILAEENIMSELRSLNAKSVRFDTDLLVQVAADKIPAVRLRTALKYLTQTWGDRPIPPTEYLDYVYGLDTVVSYRGWTIGLDVTLDPTAIAHKKQKQSQLMAAYQALGIDAVGVIDAHQPLKPQLSAIIKAAS